MIDMPRVVGRDAEMRAHDKEKTCRALAINLGGPGPICAVFVKSTVNCAGADVIGDVLTK